jgi:hypothetical protein
MQFRRTATSRLFFEKTVACYVALRQFRPPCPVAIIQAFRTLTLSVSLDFLDLALYRNWDHVLCAASAASSSLESAQLFAASPDAAERVRRDRPACRRVFLALYRDTV